jgi:hypothetical protein
LTKNTWRTQRGKIINESGGVTTNFTQNKRGKKPGVVAHVCNPRYLGGRDRRITV